MKYTGYRFIRGKIDTIKRVNRSATAEQKEAEMPAFELKRHGKISQNGCSERGLGNDRFDSGKYGNS